MVVFLTLLIGIMDVSQFIFTQQSLTEQVHIAARWAAVNRYDAESIRNVVLYGSAETHHGPAFLNLLPENVRVERKDEGTSADRVEISIVNYPFTLFTPGLAKTFSASRPVFETVSMPVR